MVVQNLYCAKQALIPKLPMNGRGKLVKFQKKVLTYQGEIFTNVFFSEPLQNTWGNMYLIEHINSNIDI